jgi:hypothetical protein
LTAGNALLAYLNNTLAAVRCIFFIGAELF